MTILWVFIEAFLLGGGFVAVIAAHYAGKFVEALIGQYRPKERRNIRG